MADCKESERLISAKRRSRNPVSLDLKSKIIKLCDGGLSISEVSRKFELPRTTVSSIIKDKARIESEVNSSGSLRSTMIRKRDGLIAEMEKLLIIWLESQRASGMPPSFAAIQAQAKSLFESIKQERGGGSHCGAFLASSGWFTRFKTRHNLPSLRVQGELSSGDDQVANALTEMLAGIIEKGGYRPEQIFNVDETGLYWKKMPSQTYIAKEERSMPGYKSARDRLTLLLGSNAAGTCKLKPMVVYHRENPRALKGTDKRYLPVLWKSNSKACITDRVFNDWFSHDFVPAVQHYLKEKNISFKVLLILDNSPGRKLQLMDINPNVEVVYLPPNTAKLLQPMDQGLFSSFKACYLRRTFEIAAAEGNGVDSFSLRQFWKSFNIADAMKMVAESWEEAIDSNSQRAWKKLCPETVANIHDGDDGVEEAVAAVVDVSRELGLEVEPEDVRELLDSHSEELTHQDLLMLAEGSEDEDCEEEDSEEEDCEIEEVYHRKELTTHRLSEALGHLESAMAIFSEDDPNVARSTRVNACILNSYACYKEIYLEKRKASMQTSLYNFILDQQPSTSDEILSNLTDNEC